VFDCTGLLPVPLPCMALSPTPPTPSPSTSSPPRAFPSPLPVNVHQQLLLDGRLYPHVLSIGDCCSPPLPCSKLAYTAELQAIVAAHNVAQLSRRVDRSASAPASPSSVPLLSFPQSLSSILPAPTLICCSLGAWDGVLVFNDVAVTGLLAALMKLVIEVSKVRQYRGEAVAEALWSFAEPTVFAVNRLYQPTKAAVVAAWRAATTAGRRPMAEAALQSPNTE
jgi:hypothetical protein